MSNTFKYHGPPSRVDMYLRNIQRHGIGVYFVKESQFLLPFFGMTQKYVPTGGRILEFGYGPGTLGIYLSCIGYKVVGIDMDPDVVELARKNNKRLDGSVNYQMCDMSEIDKIFGPNSFDAVVSDVTLEHFNDNDILAALEKQFIVAKLNIFAVHCSNAPPKPTGREGGERLLKPSYWENLIKKAGGRVIDRFGYGFQDTRMGQLNWRIPELADRIFYRRLARFAAATGFVVKPIVGQR
jgi:SAM-dependent methyltransferase